MGSFWAISTRTIQFVRNSNVISVLLILIAAHCDAQVYSAGIYSGGTLYNELSSTGLPFPPNKFKLTLVSWRADSRGLTIMDVYHKTAPGDVSRRLLEVACGSETFQISLDYVPSNRVTLVEEPLTVRGSGNLALSVMQCVTNRSGRLSTNSLPAFQANWIRQSRPKLDVFVLDGDHFQDIHKFLEQAYGKTDAEMNSSGINGRSITYTPAQIGVVLNLTAGLGVTIVSVIENQKP